MTTYFSPEISKPEDNERYLWSDGVEGCRWGRGWGLDGTTKPESYNLWK